MRLNKMKLYLHIGTEKTGTKTIQETLFQNQSVLQKNGYHFLQCAGTRNNRKLPAYCMADENFDDFFRDRKISTLKGKKKFQEKFKSDFEYELRKLPNNIHTIIASSEHFHSRIKRKNEIKYAFDFFSKYFNEIDVICYLREQSATCVSLYSTAIKSGHIPNLKRMLSNCVPSNRYYNYYEMLCNWGEVFGLKNCKIRIFSKEKFLNENLIDDFFSQINSSLIHQIAKETEKRNGSLSKLGQYLGLVTNIIFPKYRRNGDINQLRTKAISAISRNFKATKEKAHTASSNAIYANFAESNTLLNQKFLNKEGNCFKEVGAPRSINTVKTKK